MPCSPTCACLDEPGLECLSVTDPARFGYFAAWCAGDDPIRRLHVRNRSRIAAGMSMAPVTVAPVPIPVTLALLARMKSCPHWQAASDCGCGHNRCAAGKGNQGVVSHRDCFHCLDPDMDLPPLKG